MVFFKRSDNVEKKLQRWKRKWSSGIVLSKRQFKRKKHYKDGKYDGPTEFYHKNGQLFWEGNYKDGKYDGLWKSYNENGELRWKGYYEYGKQVGIWEWFNQDGSLKKTETWKDGERVSE